MRELVPALASLGLVVLAALLSFAAKAAPVEPFASAPGRVVRLSPALDRLLDPAADLETLATGHAWLEGPAWQPREGFLVYSDIPSNRIYRWSPGSRPEVYLEKSGYAGPTPFRGREPGSNGLVWDPRGRLVICEHGNRRITRLEDDGSRTVLADRYRGRRLNSPNDAIYHSSGDLYFTDPPFGLPDTFSDPARELDFQGVFRLRQDSELELLIGDIRAPNGIALSPDERTLYLTDVDPATAGWLAYSLDAEGRPGERRLLADARPWMRLRRGGPDGLVTDHEGNLFAAGPEAVFVFSPAGALLGLVEIGEPVSNVEWGEDGHSLFVTASGTLFRLRTLAHGPRWPS